MNTKRFYKILIATSLLIIITSANSFAAVAIKENASPYTGVTISTAFDLCRAMKDTGGSLAGANVDVHMATNREWAVVSYFSNSPYGTNQVGQNTGVQVTLNGKNYLSTNGNVTGVMDWGKLNTFTAGVVTSYATEVKNTEVRTYGKSILDNAGTSLVDTFSASIDKKILGTNTWYTSNSVVEGNPDGPFSYRIGLFGFKGGNKYDSNCTGKASDSTTFRPIIFNY